MRDIIKCHNCGYEHINNNYKFCPKCGVEVNQLISVSKEYRPQSFFRYLILFFICNIFGLISGDKLPLSFPLILDLFFRIFLSSIVIYAILMLMSRICTNCNLNMSLRHAYCYNCGTKYKKDTLKKMLASSFLIAFFVFIVFVNFFK